MELRHLRYFVKAAEEKNISRASELLNISQPAVSRQLKDLEEELGLPLFKREINGLKLTKAGEIALIQSKKILEQSNSLIESIRQLADQDKQATIKIGYLPSILNTLLTNAIRALSKSNPNHCIEIFELSPKQQEEALRNGKIDLALIGDYGDNFDKSFNVETLMLSEQAILVPSSHRLAKRKSVDLSEFSSDIFLSLNDEVFPGRIQMMKELFKVSEINPKISHHVNKLSDLIGLVSSGMGVAVAPSDLKNLPHPNVTFIKIRKPNRKVKFSAIWRKDNDISEIVSLVKLLKTAKL